MTEVRMKNLFRMHIHPNVWLCLSLEVVRDHLLFSLFGFNKLFSLHRRFVPSVSRGFLKFKLKQKTFNLFSLCHPQGYP